MLAAQTRLLLQILIDAFSRRYESALLRRRGATVARWHRGAIVRRRRGTEAERRRTKNGF